MNARNENQLDENYQGEKEIKHQGEHRESFKRCAATCYVLHVILHLVQIFLFWLISTVPFSRRHLPSLSQSRLSSAGNCMVTCICNTVPAPLTGNGALDTSLYYWTLLKWIFSSLLILCQALGERIKDET